MADNRNPCSEAAASVGARERLTISRWTSKSFLAPSAFVNFLLYDLVFWGQGIFGPLIDDRLKEKFLKPRKNVLCFHFRVCVCLCVCPYASYRAHLWPRNLLGPRNTFFLLQNLHFYAFAFFRFFSLYKTSKFCVSSYRSQFITLECDILVERILKFWIIENPFWALCGKIRPWYSITLYHLCSDRRCAC